MKIKLSKKLRKEIYLELAKNYQKFLNGLSNDQVDFANLQMDISEFICINLRHTIQDIKGVYPYSEDYFFSIFPELALFTPVDLEYITNSADTGGGWFSIRKSEGFKERVQTLLFCAEMCK